MGRYDIAGIMSSKKYYIFVKYHDNRTIFGVGLSRSSASYKQSQMRPPVAALHSDLLSSAPVDPVESATSSKILVAYYCQDGRNAAKGTDARERPRWDSHDPW